MEVIKLKGDELEYWKKHSDLIDDLSEWEEDGVLELSRELFPLFSDNDWKFFQRLLHKKDIHYTKSKKYNTFVYNIKNYKKEDAEKVLDYIMYGKKYSDIYNLLKKREISLPKNENNNENNNNNNNNNNNDYNNKNNNNENDRPEIVINNNNNYMKKVPKAKQRSKSLKKESKKKSKTLKKEYLKAKEGKTIEELMKELQSLKKNLRETAK